MDGRKIRSERRRRGWSQAQLAKRVGLSQPYISMVERGRIGPRNVLEKISVELGISLGDLEKVDSESSVPDIRWPEPTENLSPDFSITKWQRPKPSGDAVVTVPTGEHSALILAVDVAGDFPVSVPTAIFLSGWIRGRIEEEGSPPRLETIASQLDTQLKRLGVGTAYFLAQFTGSHRGDHSVSYEAISSGFPEPLLLVGTGSETLPSTREREDGGIELAVQYSVLNPPWRLVIATDGLLRRLGSGDEHSGKRSLLKWQSGPLRRTPFEVYAATEADIADDETLAIIEYDGWDLGFDFDVSNNDIRQRAKRKIRDHSSALLGIDRALSLQSVVAEIVDNVMVHAYGGAGRIVIKARKEGNRYRVEITDWGCGGAELDRALNVASAHGCNLKVWRNHPSGTVVSIETGS